MVDLDPAGVSRPLGAGGATVAPLGGGAPRRAGPRVARAAFLFFAGFAALQPASTRAQTPPRSLGVTVTQSVASASAAHGSVCPCPDQRDVLAPVSVTQIEIELGLPLLAAEGWGLDYPIRAVPLSLARNNPVEAARMEGVGRWTMSVDTRRSSTVGFGIKPLGLRGWVGSPRLRLELDASAGVMHFGSPLLAANATRFNFVYDYAVGLSVAVPGGGRALLGYRHHHLSNAGLGDVNPGLDSHAAYVGLRLD